MSLKDHPRPDVSKEIDPSQLVAALDIGSNSIHMVLGRRVGHDFQILDRVKEQVRLASGLDKKNNLDQASMDRALTCLAEMSEYLEGIPRKNIRAVATHTLRIANNSDDFVKQAKKHFPIPIQIISGFEEARLIYQGAVHISDLSNKVFIMDIGGGSTEFAIGENMTEEHLRSVPLGCITLTKRFFSSGIVTRERFQKAVTYAEKEINTFRKIYLKTGWDVCLGSSGSIKSVSNILKEDGFQKRSITLDHLLEIRNQLLASKEIKDINIPGLSERRREIFPAALVILIAAFKRLKIERMEYSRGALREGVLYEMEE